MQLYTLYMKEEKKHILIVEDDVEIAQLVRINLEDAGYAVTSVHDGNTGYQVFRDNNFDMLVLDLMLPGMDGLDICKKIRAENTSLPILILTAKSEEFDKVLGLELGADDYLTKPFGIRELVARVKALIRRAAKPARASATSGSNTPIDFGSLHIDPARHRAKLDDRSLELTAKEFDLLLLFARHPGKVFSRQELLDEIWGYRFDGYEHTVNTHINRLRTKIEETPSEPRYLKTVWGVGYRFAEKDELPA